MSVVIHTLYQYVHIDMQVPAGESKKINFNYSYYKLLRTMSSSMINDVTIRL